MSSESSYFSVHTHSHFSPIDGMSKVPDLVKRAHQYKHPALATTDHGNMSATVQAYTECAKYGMKYFPGVEGYLIDPSFSGELEDKECGKAGRYHLGLLAATEDGYKALVEFVSMTHTRPRFNRFPRFTLSDLAQLGQAHGDDLVLTTGCFFGWFQQTLLKEGENKASRILQMYSQWFPNTYVEVQHHNIVHDEDPDEDSMTDDQLVKQIIELADDANLPVLATQDSHYCDQKDKLAHAQMKAMTFGSANEFPGDSFHLASADWVREHYTDDQWERFEEAYEELFDLHDLRIKPLDTYKPDVPTTVDDPMRYIRRRTMKALRKLGLTKPKYLQRAEFELDIIDHLGMGSYFVICEDLARFCLKRGICLEVRGSANGSLVLYALGVTSVDPVVWGGDFERFLSKDRTKPPDVDFDVEDVGRGPVLEYLMGKYKAYQIGTWSQMGIRVDEHTGEEKGSILVSWQMSKRRQCEEDAWKMEQAQAAKENRKPVKYKAVDEGKHKFAYKYGWVKTIDDVRKVSPKDYRGLKLLNKMDVYRSYGVHAAGVLLSGDNIAVEEYVPRMLVASSDTIVTQFDMDDVEQLGLLKLDVLGQATLTVMRICQELIGISNPTDFSWIPLDDAKAIKECKTGRTDNGLFHLSGYTKAKGAREMKVRNTKDLILLQALYMPGCMDVAPGQSISQKDLYLKRRRSAYERSKITYLGPEFEDALKDTYGAVIFQEQVINIMRNLGMSIGSINKFFKVVKDSGKGAVERNAARMAEVRDEFDDHCDAAGIDPEAAWNQTAAFVSYGFNKNHATGYGIRTYRTAYLKAHYPLEYMTALLIAWAGRTKEKDYIAEARKMEIPILPPDVNISSNTWTLDRRRKAIRRGLVTITGIGAATALQISSKAPFTDLDDMCARVKSVTGTKAWLEENKFSGAVEHLRKAGALKSLGVKPE